MSPIHLPENLTAEEIAALLEEVQICLPMRIARIHEREIMECLLSFFCVRYDADRGLVRYLYLHPLGTRESYYPETKAALVPLVPILPEEEGEEE